MQDKVLRLLMDICQTDTPDATKAKLREIKYLLQPHFKAYQSYLKRIHSTKKMWLLQHLNDVFTGGIHSYNRSASIERQLQSKIVNEDENSRQARCECAQDLVSQTTRASSQICRLHGESSLSLKLLLQHVLKMEDLNETFHFKFDKNRGIDALTNGAFYLCIKKAFTPFAAMHMLKQI